MFEWLGFLPSKAIDSPGFRTHDLHMPHPLDYAEPKRIVCRPLLGRISGVFVLAFLSLGYGGPLLRAIGYKDKGYAWSVWGDSYLPVVFAIGYITGLLALSQPETRTVWASISVVILTLFICTCVGSGIITGGPFP